MPAARRYSCAKATALRRTAARIRERLIPEAARGHRLDTEPEFPGLGADFSTGGIRDAGRNGPRQRSIPGRRSPWLWLRPSPGQSASRVKSANRPIVDLDRVVHAHAISSFRGYWLEPDFDRLARWADWISASISRRFARRIGRHDRRCPAMAMQSIKCRNSWRTRLPRPREPPDEPSGRATSGGRRRASSKVAFSIATRNVIENWNVGAYSHALGHNQAGSAVVVGGDDVLESLPRDPQPRLNTDFGLPNT